MFIGRSVKRSTGSVRRSGIQLGLTTLERFRSSERSRRGFCSSDL